jgi:hypothetical protein
MESKAYLRGEGRQLLDLIGAWRGAIMRPCFLALAVVLTLAFFELAPLHYA